MSAPHDPTARAPPAAPAPTAPTVREHALNQKLRKDLDASGMREVVSSSLLEDVTP
jgi:hypothetical protein